jgi:hypothetical protein
VVLLCFVAFAAGGCGGGASSSPAHHASAPQDVRSPQPRMPPQGAAATSTTSAPTSSGSAAPAVGGGCRLPRPRVVAARRVGRVISVQWAVSERPPASCGRVGLLVTARSLTASMGALPERGSNGGTKLLGALAGTARMIDIVGPIMPPYEADISLFGERGGRVEARAPVAATDDPSPQAVRTEIRRREACRADAGLPSDCHIPAVMGAHRLIGVTSHALARAVHVRLAGFSADIAVQRVSCRPEWSCTARFTLDYGKYPMRVTYRLGGTPARGCWTLRGWSFTKPGPSGEGLPTPSTGCVR